MEQAGLRNVRYEILAGGIIALHHGDRVGVLDSGHAARFACRSS